MELAGTSEILKHTHGVCKVNSVFIKIGHSFFGIPRIIHSRILEIPGYIFSVHPGFGRVL